jgi:hypothetical protein
VVNGELQGMKKEFHPSQYALIVLPGFLALVQNIHFPGVENGFVLFAPLVFLSIIIGFAVGYQQKPSISWLFPTFALLFWEIYKLGQWAVTSHLIFLRESGGTLIRYALLFVLVSTLLQLLIVGALLAWKFGNLVTLQMRIFISLLFTGFATGIVIFGQGSGVALLVFSTIIWCLFIVPILFVGLALATKLGADSLMLVVACQAVWLDVFLVPIPFGLSNQILYSDSSQTLLFLQIFRTFPVLVFFILLPLAMLTTKISRQTIVILSLLAIGLTIWIRLEFLRDLSTVSMPTFVEWIFLTGNLILPLILAGLIYPARE